MTAQHGGRMNVVMGKVLRYGVLLSASIIVLGTIGLAASQGSSDASAFYRYPYSVSGNIPATPSAFFEGLAGLSPFSWIELGVILLIATPVSNVLVSIFIFGEERDRPYVLIATVVLVVLLFSMLATPFIPLFHG